MILFFFIFITSNLLYLYFFSSLIPFHIFLLYLLINHRFLSTSINILNAKPYDFKQFYKKLQIFEVWIQEFEAMKWIFKAGRIRKLVIIELLNECLYNFILMNIIQLESQHDIDLNCQSLNSESTTYLISQKKYSPSFKIQHFKLPQYPHLDLIFQSKQLSYLNYITLKYYLTINSKILSIKNHNLKLLIIRLLHKINQSHHNISAYINVYTSTIYFQKKTIYTNFFNSHSQNQSTQELLAKKYLLQRTMPYLKELLYKISLQQPKNIQFNIPIILDQITQKVLLKPIKANQANKYQGNSTDIKQKIQQQQTSYLAFPNPKLLNAKDRTTLYNQITFINKNETIWNKKESRGFTDIFIGSCKFKYTDDKNKTQFHKILIKKVYHKQSQILNQKKILSYLTNLSSVNITKFYYTKDQPYYLYSDYYSHQSLQKYYTLNSQTFSWYTKLYILYQISQGIRFLQQKLQQNLKIFHCDLKCENILIGKNLLVRINDFGEATINNPKALKLKEIRYSKFYSAPQIFMPKNITEKTDMFSMGIIMNYLLFSFYLTQFSSKDYEKDMISKQYYSKLKCMNQRLMGYGQLWQLLYTLILRCVSVESNKQGMRPQFDQLSIILRLCIKYLDKFY